MAIGFLRVNTLKRAEGARLVRAVAYCLRTELNEWSTGEKFNYRNRGREDLIYSETIVPKECIYRSDEELWNTAEALERRHDSRVGREITVAIPHELDREQQIESVKKFCQALVERYRCGITMAVHHPNREGDQRNYHAHLLMTARSFNEQGELDKKIRQLDLSTTGPKEVEWMQSAVEKIFNEYLGQSKAISFAKYKEAGYKGQPHWGKKIVNWERKTGQVHPARQQYEAMKQRQKDKTDLALSKEELSV